MSRMRWWILLLMVMFALSMGSCRDTEGPTSPPVADVTTSSSSDGSSSSEVASPPEAPAPDPGQNFSSWKTHVTSDAAGNVTFNNPSTEVYEGELCYYWNGPHPQTLALEPIEVRVQPGHSKTFPFPAIQLEEEECEKEIQFDAGFVHCTNSNSANLQPAGTDHLHESGYVTLTQECEEECVPGEWKVVNVEGPTCGDWGSCDQESLVGCLPEKCYECRDCATIITESDGCKTRTSIKDGFEKQEVPCPRPTPTPPPPGLCYYTPDCRVEFHTSTACPDLAKERMCENEGGVWSNWNGQSNQCRIDLPGILKSNFRLVPGQSHPDCLKFTGSGE